MSPRANRENDKPGLRVMTEAERAARREEVWDLHLRGGTIPIEEFMRRRGRSWPPGGNQP